MFFLKQSIITRIGASMFAISLMAIASMIGSVIVAQNTQGDAAGINDAGSLRMMSYKISAQMAQYHTLPSPNNLALVTHTFNQFEQQLNSASLQQVIPANGDIALHSLYQNIITQWQTKVRPTLELELTGQQVYGLAAMTAFVQDIDAMVLMLEHSTESKIKLLSLVQAVSLSMTALIILIAMLDIKNNVVKPLKLLVKAAQKAGQGHLEGRVDYDSDDELGLLARTFNQMASELSKIYHNLEQRVENKTSQLQKSNEALQLLYDASRSLNQQQDLCHRIMPVMQQLETVTPFGPIDVTLFDLADPNNHRTLSTQCAERPSHCRRIECNQCLVRSASPTDLPVLTHKTLALPIKTQDHYFGEFNAQYLPHKPPTATEIKLIETLVENLATSMSLDLKSDQDQHMSLIEERSVIARELHDSLAQSLSYLKTQVSRLQILRKKQAQPQHIDEVVGELKTGLNNAYLQLRELLTTFRLQLDAPGLEPALQATVTEFSQRLGFDIEYTCSLDHQRLTPNEEIHVLQLVREALANVVKHALASEVSLKVTSHQGHINVEITDNGIGLPEQPDPSNHYGLIIMQDRTDTLGGQLSVATAHQGGTQVRLHFNSKHIN
ncbi:MAG: HAMP domain-containing protein [Gammaproteobacteria bacterium]|nr:HAMP domain-containing protein [Gammaproteobacteria bacterium]